SELHESLKKIEDPGWRLQAFLSSIRLSDDSTRDYQRLIAAMNQALAECQPLQVLKPRLFAIGSLESGLGIYNSDLNLMVNFDAVTPEAAADFEPAKTTLKIMQSLLQVGVEIAYVFLMQLF